MKFALCFALIGATQAAVGDDCSGDPAVCAAGEYCASSDSLCATLLADGEACDAAGDGSDCLSGSCEAGSALCVAVALVPEEPEEEPGDEVPEPVIDE